MHRNEYTCKSAIYWNESASLINEKCNFEYFYDLTPEPSILDAGDYLLLAGLPVPWTFFLYKRKTNSKSYSRKSLYYYRKKTIMFVLNRCRNILLSREFFSCEDENEDLHMYYPVNMAVLNYLWTQIPETERIDGHMQIESADLYGKDMNEPDDQFTVSAVLLSYQDEGVLIEYTLANPIPFKDVVECIINDEKVHLTREDLSLSNTKIENWFTQQNKWLAVIHTARLIGVLGFVIGMIMVKKWLSIKILSLPLIHL